MVLVVASHCIGGFKDRALLAPAELWDAIYDWMYLFHTRTFFFMAGLFALPTDVRPIGQYLQDKVRRVAYPYVVWTLVTWCAVRMLGSAANNVASLDVLLKTVYSPMMHTWFLYALFLMYLITAAAMGIKHHRQLTILTVFVLLLAAELAGWTQWWDSLSELARFGIFFALGVVAGRPWIAWMSRWPLWCCGLIAGAGLAGMTWMFTADWTATPPGHLIASSLGVIGTLALARCTAVLPPVTGLALLGICSLEVYMAHALTSVAARLLALRILHLNAYAALTLVIIVGVFGTLGLVVLLRRLGLGFLFTWPKRQTKTAHGSITTA